MNTIRQWLRSLAWVVLHRWPDVEDRREDDRFDAHIAELARVAA